MARISGEVLIRRPVEDVFDFVADERNEPRFNPLMTHVEKLSDGRPGQRRPVGPAFADVLED